MPVPAKPLVGKPLPNPDDVRSWSCPCLLDYLDPIFASFADDSIKTAFQDKRINGNCFLEVFGDPDIYTEFDIPQAPGWYLSKEVNDILGKTTPPLQAKRTYLLNWRPRL